MNLNDRYYARFGLEYNPFIKNNSSYFFFESKDAEEVKYKLDYLFKVKGIGIKSKKLYKQFKQISL